MNKKLFILLFSIFLDVLWFSFILPILPFIIQGFWWNSFTVGFVISATAIWMFLWWLIFWKLSDKFNRKNILEITILLNIFWYILFWLSWNLLTFFIARFLCWMWWWWISVIQAFISDISSEKRRIINMWYSWASIWLWFTLWPILWTLFYNSNLTQMWFVSAIILLLNLVSVIIFLPNEKIKYEKEKVNIKHVPKNLLILFITFFIITSAIAWTQTIFSLFLVTNFLFNFKQIGFAFWFLGIITILYQIFFIKHISKFLDEKKMIYLWLFCMWIWLILLWINNNLIWFYVILILMAIWISNTNSSIYSLITCFSLKKDFGKNMWINTAFWSVADIFWPLISWTLYLHWISLPFYFFWLMLLITLVFVFNVFIWQKNI